MFKYFLHSLIFSFLFISTVFGSQTELLKTSDINKIMQQIFSQHVDQKEISTSIIKNSLKNYIDQFDPDRLYLLESEVAPYLNPSDDRVMAIEREYKKGNYPAYEDLNQLFQKAISRARSYRSLIELENAGLVKEAKLLKGSMPLPGNFAENEQELKERLKESVIFFLRDEMQRYGSKHIEEKADQVLTMYETALRVFEEGYNYRLKTGEMISSEQQENLFALHVLKSIAKSLDAHTSIYNPEEAYDMKVRLEKGFEGIGIVFQKNDEAVVISNVVKNGPAAKSGQVLVKDEVLEVNGILVKDMPFEKLIDQVRSTDSITLVLSRKIKNTEDDNKITVTLKREPIMMDDERVDISYENFGSGIIGKITLHSFYQNDQGITSEKDVRDAIQQLDKEGNLRGLVLDLRENSGGFLSQAVKVAGLFITNGVVVISKYSNGEEKLYRDMDGKTAYNGPLIVLTSRATASAAEIVAQALQDYGVALIVGDDHTYGKGTIQSQTVTDKTNAASYFKVTVGKYYTVSGKTPQLHGVKADIVVPGPFAKAHIGEEYLEYAIKQDDQIPAVFSDKLIDIDPSVKSWYLKYYMPSLQHKQLVWKELTPILSKNSAWRIAHNKNYQLFFKKLDEKGYQAPLEVVVEEDDPHVEKNFGAGDLQMAEAVNIIKDMIYLQTKIRHNEYMVGSEEPLQKLAK